jgi:hypothetical protein
MSPTSIENQQPTERVFQNSGALPNLTSTRGCEIQEQWLAMKSSIGDVPTKQALSDVLKLALAMNYDGDKLRVGKAKDDSVGCSTSA